MTVLSRQTAPHTFSFLHHRCYLGVLLCDVGFDRPIDGVVSCLILSVVALLLLLEPTSLCRVWIFSLEVPPALENGEVVRICVWLQDIVPVYGLVTRWSDNRWSVRTVGSFHRLECSP